MNEMYCSQCDCRIRHRNPYMNIHGEIYCMECGKSFVLDELNDAMTNTFDSHFEEIADVCGFQILEVG